MDHYIMFDPNKGAEIFVKFLGQVRVHFRLALLAPGGGAEPLIELDGYNYKVGDVSFSINETGLDFENYGLSCRFITWESDFPGESYKIAFEIIQNGTPIFSIEYPNANSTGPIFKDLIIFKLT